MQINKVAKIKYIVNTYGISYTTIAKSINTTYNRLYRYLLPKDNKNYRNLNAESLALLDVYLQQY